MMRIPAAAGPTIRVVFIPALLRETAFIRLLSGTISEIRDCRLGMLNAARVPFMNPRTMRCQKRTRPVMSNVARSRVRMQLPPWLIMMICFRASLSASAPPNTEVNVRGKAKAIITMERARGESWVRRRMSHPLVICCIITARKEMKVPNHNHLKSRN
jgi:hypothetical protein